MLDGPERTVMYAILAGGTVVGMIRMSWVNPPATSPPATMETGMWIARSAGRHGIASSAVRALLDEAM